MSMIICFPRSYIQKQVFAILSSSPRQNPSGRSQKKRPIICGYLKHPVSLRPRFYGINMEPFYLLVVISMDINCILSATKTQFKADPVNKSLFEILYRYYFLSCTFFRMPEVSFFKGTSDIRHHSSEIMRNLYFCDIRFLIAHVFSNW